MSGPGRGRASDFKRRKFPRGLSSLRRTAGLRDRHRQPQTRDDIPHGALFAPTTSSGVSHMRRVLTGVAALAAVAAVALAASPAEASPTLNQKVLQFARAR